MIRRFENHTPMQYVKALAEVNQELVAALEAALPDLHILDSRLQAEAERAECGYAGLESLRLVEAALEKVGER